MLKQSLISTLFLACGITGVSAAPANPNTTIVGYMLGDDAASPPGIYSFHPAAEISPVMLSLPGGMEQPDAGAVLYDGRYQVISEKYYSYTQTFYNPETWEEIDYWPSRDIGVRSTAMAVDPVTNTVYGFFYDSLEAQNYVWGTLDFKGYTSGVERIEISKIYNTFVALAADKNGRFYAVDIAGQFYSLDKTDGSTTLIGSTGVEPGAGMQGACVDPRTGAFYWAALLADGSTGLYNVDTDSGTAQLIGTFPHGEEFTGLYTLAPEAEDGAPAAVGALSLAPGEGTRATVSFTMPEVRYDGNPLTDTSLSWSVYGNGVSVKEGTAAPGAVVTEECLFEGGETTVAVCASNAEGEGPRVSLKQWIGPDAPLPVSSLKGTYDVSTGKIVLTWTAPTEGEHGTDLSDAAITYRIVRENDGEVFTSATNSFSDTPVIEGMEIFSYSITALNGTVASQAVSTGRFLAGNGYDVPYRPDLAASDVMDYFTVIDANDDGRTWAPHTAGAVDRYGIGIQYPSADRHDDWLISAPVKMEAGIVYGINLSEWSQFDSPEEFSVYMGTGDTPESMTIELMEPTVYASGTPNPVKLTGTVPVSGSYRIGIHATTGSDDAWKLIINGFEVVEYSSVNAPGSVTDLQVEPAAGGVLSATLKFKAPAVTFGGESLAAVDGFEIFHNGSDEPVATAPAAEGGADVTVNDVPASDGDNTWSVRAFNSYGSGVASDVSAFAGVDIPLPPVAATSRREGLNVVLEWEPSPAEGANGGYVDVEALEYEVWDPISSSSIVSGLKELTYTVAASSGTQQYCSYQIYASNRAGESKQGRPAPSVIVGAPHELPLSESFAGGKPSKGPWMYAGEMLWGVIDVESLEDANVPDPYDGDGGMAAFVPEAEGQVSTLTSGHIRVKGNDKAALMFYCRSVAGCQTTLQIGIYVDGSDTFVPLSTVAVGEEEWTPAIVSLNGHTDNEYVQLGFRATAGKDLAPVYVDAITVKDTYDHNLKYNHFYGPRMLELGVPAMFRLEVGNDGAQTATDYSVELYRDGELEASVDGEPLVAGDSRMFEIPVSADDSYGDVAVFQFRINYAADENVENNLSREASIPVARNGFPVPEGLTAVPGEGSVGLSWRSPDLTLRHKAAVTEDFESYDDFIISGIGDWTCVDVKGANTYAIRECSGYGHSGEPYAWQVFNPAAAGIDLGYHGEFVPHSGDKVLLSPCSLDAPNDYWLISPELSGGMQMVSFWVRSTLYGPERFETLYSTTGKELGDFEKIDVASGNAPANAWGAVSTVLPEGTKYFAIRCTSDDRYAMLVDDITFTPAVGSEEDFVLKGYNIFCDRRKVGTSEETSYTYHPADTDLHEYNVSAVYAQGESRFSGKVSAGALSGVSAEVDYEAVEVWAAEGYIVVDGAQGCDVTIAAADGRTVCSLPLVADRVSVPVAPGVYVVKAGPVTVKLVVK